MNAAHTKGLLAVVFEDATIEKGGLANAHCRLEAENSDVVAIVTLPFPFDTSYDERDANAHRLALAWNSYDELVKDAARYRWLRASGESDVYVMQGCDFKGWCMEGLDDAIDAKLAGAAQ